MNPRVWWYVARAGGLVAWALLAASTLWGLALTTRAFAGRAAPRWLLDLHRFLGGLSVVFVAVHLTGIVADTFVHFGPADVLVPLASAWHPVWVAWGVVALYLLVAVEITSLLRPRIPHRLWKAVHATSFLLFTLATVHVLVAGTDTDDAWALYPVIVVTMAVAFLAVARAAAGPRPDRAPTLSP
ncbi:MAG TPA: ferric reductase-like transmembrane domain-containing protein [Acidimicrobiales bacterium]|nr:ferric reductase-like transmembrane domain-containing protein [Acidimicrobiales bacterium]